MPGAVTEHDLSSIGAMFVTATKGSVQEVWGAVAGAAPTGGAARAAATSEPIGKLWLDGLRRPVLDRSVQQIGAPAAWALGYEGDGVVVAVLDTGVDDAHPDLEGSVVESRNFTRGPDGDEVGHGTHVASIIAGSGAAQGGLHRGVAPRVQLLAGKVCDLVGCPESSIIAGMQWAVEEEGARIVNMSLGGLDLCWPCPTKALAVWRSPRRWRRAYWQIRRASAWESRAGRMRTMMSSRAR